MIEVQAARQFYSSIVFPSLAGYSRMGIAITPCGLAENRTGL